MNYKSGLQDQDAFDDEAAKQQLSLYGYNKLFLVEYKTSHRLQFVVQENDTIVWPHGKPQNCDEHILIRGNAASGGGGDDEGNGRDDGDKKDGSTGSGKEDEDSGDTSDEEA
jgi:hypothetical protein